MARVVVADAGLHGRGPALVHANLGSAQAPGTFHSGPKQFGRPSLKAGLPLSAIMRLLLSRPHPICSQEPPRHKPGNRTERANFDLIGTLPHETETHHTREVASGSWYATVHPLVRKDIRGLSGLLDVAESSVKCSPAEGRPQARLESQR